MLSRRNMRTKRRSNFPESVRLLVPAEISGRKKKRHKLPKNVRSKFIWKNMRKKLVGSNFPEGVRSTIILLVVADTRLNRAIS